MLTGVLEAPGKHLFPGFSHFVGAALTPWLMPLHHPAFLSAFDPAPRPPPSRAFVIIVCTLKVINKITFAKSLSPVK